MPRLSQTGGEEWRMQPSILHMRTMFLLAVWWSYRWRLGAHTSENIAGHSCGRYTQDEVKQLERAKNDLWHYPHYHDRYKAHTDSLEAEVQLKEKLQMKVSTLEAMEKESKDLSWVTNGLYRLFRSRRFLSYSYPFAYYMFGDDLENDMTKKETEIKKNLFEDQQQQLEASVEKLSMFLEEPFHGYAEDKVRETRMKIIALSKITDDFCKKLQGSLLYSISAASETSPMSSMFNNSISISVSDDDSDELAGRMRVRVRRKRKKSVFRGKNELARRVLGKLLRWWPVLLFLPAAGLLVFEASRIGRKPSPVVVSGLVSQKKQGLVEEKKSEGNLNRLDPTTRVVGGVRERCLKLLPPEELQHLDIPLDKEPTNPIKKVVYISENDTPYLEGNITLSQQHMEATRFNLFTGNQTLEQREKSFKVNETAVVHCGFCSENGGFRISDEDKNYLLTCKVAVSTCAFGGGDDLYQPIGMSEASLRKVCYVAFWDEITLAAQEAEGRRVGENQFIGKWRIVIVRNLPFSDQRLNGKIPKMLSHRLFPHARYSIWVDSKSQFRRDPLGVLEALLWRSNSVVAISEHGARSSVYDEAKAVVKKNKATPEEVEVQLSQYRRDGLPEDKRFNGKKALAEASVIAREHTPLTNLFMCLWFNEVVRFTSRDQLSFPYVLWRLKVLKNINMFPVCTRKDLVNSMGHLRKAKPLIKLTPGALV